MGIEEKRSAILKGKAAFRKVRGLITDERIPLELRKRFVECFVLFVVLYGSKTWIIRKKQENYLE